MKEKLRQHYLNFGPRRFVMMTVLVLLATDLINSYYLKLYWMKKDYSSLFVQVFIRSGKLVIEDFNRDTLLEMTGFVDNLFYFMIFIVLINNLFFYFFYLKKRLWAQGYVLFYTLSAGIFSVSFVLDNSGLGAGWFCYNFMTIFMYAYLYFGVKYLKAETTLAHEKKAQ